MCSVIRRLIRFNYKIERDKGLTASHAFCLGRRQGLIWIWARTILFRNVYKAYNRRWEGYSIKKPAAL